MQLKPMKAAQRSAIEDELKPVGDASDPVWTNSQGFWFFDETWSEIYGPWPTEGEAREQLDAYAKTL
jgi:hypothetical protein